MRTDVSGWTTRLSEQDIERYTAAAHGATSRWPTARGARRSARRSGSRWSKARESSTFGEVHAQAQRLASAFAALGLKPGEVISLQLPNWAETLALNLARLHGRPGGQSDRADLPRGRGGLHPQGRAHAAVPGPADASAASTIRPWRSGCAASCPTCCDVVVLRGQADGCLSYEELLARGDAAGSPGRARPQRRQARALHLGHDRHTEGRAAQPQHHHVGDRRGDPLLGHRRARRGADALAGDPHHRLSVCARARLRSGRQGRADGALERRRGGGPDRPPRRELQRRRDAVPEGAGGRSRARARPRCPACAGS